MNANRRPVTAAEYRKAQARAMTERQLLDAVLGTPRKPGLALALGWRGYHTHRSEHSPAGFPDLTLIKPGRLLFAELKTERGKTSTHQDTWITGLESVEEAVAMLDPTGVPVPIPVRIRLWRPMDLIDGTIEAELRKGDTPTPGIALLPRIR